MELILQQRQEFVCKSPRSTMIVCEQHGCSLPFCVRHAITVQLLQRRNEKYGEGSRVGSRSKCRSLPSKHTKNTVKKEHLHTSRRNQPKTRLTAFARTEQLTQHGLPTRRNECNSFNAASVVSWHSLAIAFSLKSKCCMCTGISL